MKHVEADTFLIFDKLLDTGIKKVYQKSDDIYTIKKKLVTNLNNLVVQKQRRRREIQESLQLGPLLGPRSCSKHMRNFQRTKERETRKSVQ
jgi:hypothetical protein